MSLGEYVLHNEMIIGRTLNDDELILRHNVHMQDDEILRNSTQAYFWFC